MEMVIDTKKLQTTPYYAKNCAVTMEDIIKCGTPLSKAYWIERFDDEDKWLECSNCHFCGNDAFNFCPHCGSDMR